MSCASTRARRGRGCSRRSRGGDVQRAAFGIDLGRAACQEALRTCWVADRSFKLDEFRLRHAYRPYIPIGIGPTVRRRRTEVSTGGYDAPDRNQKRTVDSSTTSRIAPALGPRHPIYSSPSVHRDRTIHHTGLHLRSSPLSWLPFHLRVAPTLKPPKRLQTPRHS